MLIILNTITPRLGYLEWKHYMNAFGYGVDLNADLPGEDDGNIPDTTGYNKDFGGNRWNSCNIVTLGIGQDRMLATPLQIANAMCIIANKGYYYTPHFVDSIENETIADTTFIGRYRVKHKPLEHISDSSFNTVQLGMHDVALLAQQKLLKLMVLISAPKQVRHKIRTGRITLYLLLLRQWKTRELLFVWWLKMLVLVQHGQRQLHL